MSLHHFVQYALVKKDTYEPAYTTHQDDEETPIESSTFEDLISQIAQWMDVDESIVVDTLDEGELAGYKIVRQEIDTWDLTEDEQAEIEKMKASLE